MSSSSQQQSERLHHAPKKGRYLSAKGGCAAADYGASIRNKQEQLEAETLGREMAKIKTAHTEQVVKNAFAQEILASWAGTRFTESEAAVEKEAN